MPYITVGQENSVEIKLRYQDQGAGQPVVLIHGYPQSGYAWEKQCQALIEDGFRAITYDRRGFGMSSHPWSGYDYDTFAADLHQLVTALDLRDVALVGHSMGTGEICRYLSRYGDERIARAVFISPLQPFLLKGDANPEGVDAGQLEDFERRCKEDRFAFLGGFFKAFFSHGLIPRMGVSDEALQYNQMIGSIASARALQACIRTWITDFRGDLPAVTVPSLILHGTDDRVVPFEATAPKLRDALQDCRLVSVDGGSHALPWTHAETVNRELLAFLRGKERGRAVA